MPLFESGPLRDDVGLLRERWDQEGSTLRSAATSFNNTAGTILTVTAGKVFYLKHLSFSNDSQPETDTIADDGTAKLYLQVNEDKKSYDFTFQTPIKFETNMTHSNAQGTWYFSVAGWEEPA